MSGSVGFSGLYGDIGNLDGKVGESGGDGNGCWVGKECGGKVVM